MIPLNATMTLNAIIVAVCVGVMPYAEKLPEIWSQWAAEKEGVLSQRGFNSCRVKLILRNLKMYFNLLSFLNTEMTYAAQIELYGRQRSL